MSVYPDHGRNGFGRTALAGNARSLGWEDAAGRWHELGLSARRLLEDVAIPAEIAVRVPGGIASAAVLRIVERPRRPAPSRSQGAVQSGDLLAGEQLRG